MANRSDLRNGDYVEVEEYCETFIVMELDWPDFILGDINTGAPVERAQVWDVILINDEEVEEATEEDDALAGTEGTDVQPE